jgi:hypothetical protein
MQSFYQHLTLEEIQNQATKEYSLTQIMGKQTLITHNKVQQVSLIIL